jgi:cell division protein FtsL
MARTNTAYKHEEQQQHSVARQKKPNISMTRTAKKSNISTIKVVLAAVSVLMLLFSVIYGKGETNKLYSEISDLNTKVEMLQSEKVRMQSEIEEKMTLKNVEDYAENVLGLKKLDKSQIEYIKIQSEDVVQIPVEEQSFFSKLKDALHNIVEYIRG